MSNSIRKLTSVVLLLSASCLYLIVHADSVNVDACNDLIQQCVTCGLVKAECLCLNGGTCNATDGSCKCPKTFAGKYCDTRVQCEPPKSVANLNWKGNSTKIGDVISAECGYGYSVIGSGQRRCMADGSWVPQPPICKANCGQVKADKTNRWAWQAAIYKHDNSEWSFACGGALISENLVVTAAYCVSDKLVRKPLKSADFKVHLGRKFKNLSDKDDGAVEFKVKRIIIHPNYHPLTYDSNIALIELNTPAKFSPNISTICLPPSLQHLNVTQVLLHDLPNGTRGTVTGWGGGSTHRSFTMPVISREECETEYRDNLGYYSFTSNMFCAGFKRGGTRQCPLDFGAPYALAENSDDDPDLSNWVLQGLVSGGILKCGRAPYITIYVNIAQFVPWLQSYTTGV